MNFNLIVLQKMYFQDYFAIRAIKLGSFTTQQSGPCCTRHVALIFPLFHSILKCEVSYFSKGFVLCRPVQEMHIVDIISN